MAGRTIDRRIARTRSLLQDALISLMIEQGYEETTVQQIIDRANVGRATFYAHFPDKRALLDSRLESLQAMLAAERPKQAPCRLGFSLAMLDHARSHLPLYRSIVHRESGGFVLAKIRSIVAELVSDDFKSLGVSRQSEQRDLAVQFVTGAFMSVLTWWMSRGAKIPQQEIDDLFHRLVMPGLAAGLGVKWTGARTVARP